MTATEELRRLLDERGVRHFDLGGVTEFVGSNGRICRTYTRPEPITVDVAIIAAKPEQAVEATCGINMCECFACSYFENRSTCGAYCNYFDRELGDDYDGGCAWGERRAARS